jgi:GNAT superfamily N-acetyltransferase
VTARPGVVVRQVDAQACRPLRQQLLRIGQPPQASVYPGDDDPRAAHLGAFEPDGTLVGIATLCKPEDRLAGIPPYRSPGLRFRGMAVAPTHTGKGVGALLVAELRRLARERGAKELWANARASAVGFYVKQGFKVVSSPFEITGLGPHLVVAEVL